MTLRDLITHAVERELRGRQTPFVLRDASAGYDAGPDAAVSADGINKAVDSLREGPPGA